MSQCLEECNCKSCDRFLLCRGLSLICDNCYKDGSKKDCECALQSYIDDTFSPFNAMVDVNGKLDSIANHLFSATKANTKKLETFMMGNAKYDIKYLPQYRKMLWIKFYRSNERHLKFVDVIQHHFDSLDITEYIYQLKIGIKILEEGEHNLIRECKTLIALMSRSSQEKAC